MGHPPPPPLPAERRLKVALGLLRTGIRMMRQNIKRSHPGASEAEIDERLAGWMRDRPPDGSGVPSRRFSSG